MTIQEMFDLLRDYRDAVDKVNNHNDETLTPELKKAITEEYHLAQKVAYYLPMFTPMSCKHCKNHKACNREREKGVCEEYEVLPLDFLVR
jgi:hypothetical protein